jgi:putative ABC transport system ATP-binding protein
VDGVTTTSLCPAPAEALEPTAEPAIELIDVRKRYSRRGALALDGVSAHIPRGSLTAVMGLSGSGKSTLLHCAAGLDRPTSGQVRLGGVDLTGLSRRKLSILRRRQVGFVFQSFNLVPTMTVAENIGLPLRLDGRSAPRAEVSQLAEAVGVGHLLRRLPHTLSGGQQQRVAIARALSTGPDVVFADEPTAALDPYTAIEVRRLLRWAVAELGQTIVLVTHEPNLAASADRTLLLHAGHLVADLIRPSAPELSRRLLDFGAGQNAVASQNAVGAGQ